MLRFGLMGLVILGAVLGGCATNGGEPAVDPAPAEGPAPADTTEAAPVATGAPLRVGVTPTSPPLIYNDEGEILGLEAAFAQLLGKELGRPVAFVELAWEQQIPALLNNEIDIIMSGMAITEQRRKQVLFCKPYLRVGQMVLVRSDEAALYRTSSDVRFTERRIAAEEDSAGDGFIAKQMRFAQHYHVDTPEVGAEALIRHDIDLYMSDAPTIWWLADTYAASGLVALPHMFSDEYLAWALRPGEQALWQDVNGAIQRLSIAGSFDAAMDAWLPARR
jgi:polar amino acid transport system substrate-binding protein